MLSVDIDPSLRTHKSFDGGYGPVGIYGLLTLGDLSHQSFARGQKCHHAGCRSSAVFIWNYNSRLALHNRYAAVGGAKIYSYGLTHKNSLHRQEKHSAEKIP